MLNDGTDPQDKYNKEINDLAKQVEHEAGQMFKNLVVAHPEKRSKALSVAVQIGTIRVALQNARETIIKALDEINEVDSNLVPSTIFLLLAKDAERTAELIRSEINAAQKFHAFGNRNVLTNPPPEKPISEQANLCKEVAMGPAQKCAIRPRIIDYPGDTF